jgi:hypothetical protein
LDFVWNGVVPRFKPSGHLFDLCCLRRNDAFCGF